VPELSLFVINYRHLIWIAAFKGLTCDSAKDKEMANKTGHRYEISDDFVNALRNTYTRGKTDKISICDKSETAMAYALNELGVVRPTGSLIRFGCGNFSCPGRFQSFGIGFCAHQQISSDQIQIYFLFSIPEIDSRSGSLLYRLFYLDDPPHRKRRR
jgi:hypothetical protein